MAITIDWENKLVNSTSSITDIVSFKNTLRDYEDNADGMLYDPIIKYKKLDLGGGAYFHAVDFINGYRLNFPNAGNYTIVGNINCDVVPNAGTFVERKTSAAFSTTSSGGGGGLTAIEVREEMDNSSVILNEIRKLMGLDAAYPLQVTDTSRTAGPIHQTITDNGTTTTVQRV